MKSDNASLSLNAPRISTPRRRGSWRARRNGSLRLIRKDDARRRCALESMAHHREAIRKKIAEFINAKPN
jgi:epoxyqueuosine reductase QueG